MLRFMICDTDVDFLEQLSALLHRLYDPCSVEYMYGPDVLEVSLRSAAGTADVLLTEVTLRGKRSIDIIRQHHVESDPLRIIYMTSEIKHCFDVYDTRHSGFLLKPFTEKCLKLNVDRALMQLRKHQEHGLVVRQGKNVHIFHFSDLQRVESRGRMICFFSGQEEIRVYGKIDTMLAQVDKRFLRCHKSHLINMDYVREFTGNSFRLYNGDIVPVSQSKRKEVREKFFVYVGLAGSEIASKV